MHWELPKHPVFPDFPDPELSFEYAIQYCRTTGHLENNLESLLIPPNWEVIPW